MAIEPTDRRVITVSPEFRRALMSYLEPEERWGTYEHSPPGIVLWTMTDTSKPFRKLIFVKKENKNE